MPISALPQDTICRIGATLAITSPVALLKELLDNAIDSGATSIDVIVSSNTVDRVEVRDNGHGIHPDDFDSLGRPGHTSKLRSFDELDTLGGSSLGFRGVALASASAVSNVSLTTSVSTEPVATVMSLTKGGGISAQRHSPAPVGTTVCATDLFAHLPVRLEATVKEAPRHLAKMKELLYSYALARHRIRLRFVVPKTPTLSWSYAPAAHGGVREAAMQLFGTELASQCIFEISPSRSPEAPSSNRLNGLDASTNRETGPVFEALLPKPSADVRKIGRGAFISVDSRPISSVRGTAKKLYALFKERISAHFSQAHSSDVPKNPFLSLNIRCPSRYYDMNIEALKDDVLFKDEQQVLDQFLSFISLIYSTAEVNCSAQLAAEATNDVMPIGVSSEAREHGLTPQVRP
jgi:DNA mismatch repair protein MutL